MNSKQLKGLAVVSIADGRKLGTIDDIRLDPATRQIAWFALPRTGGRLQGRGPLLSVARDQVHALGHDALTITDPSALREVDDHDQDGTVSLGDLSKRKVVTEGGTYVGQVQSLEFDATRLQMTAVEVSPSFFQSNKMVRDDQVISFGVDLVVVADAVCASPTVAFSATDEGVGPGERGVDDEDVR